MLVKFVLFALFAAAVLATPAEKRKESKLEKVSRTVKELDELGYIEDIRYLVGQFFRDALITLEGGRSSKRKNIEPLLLFFGVTLIKMVIGALTLIVGKSLIVTKLSLLLSVILGIKKLMEQKKQKVVIEKIHHHEEPTYHTKDCSHDNGNGNYAQNLAYNSYPQH